MAGHLGYPKQSLPAVFLIVFISKPELIVFILVANLSYFVNYSRSIGTVILVGKLIIGFFVSFGILRFPKQRLTSPGLILVFTRCFVNSGKP